MAVITVGGYAAVAFFRGCFEPDNHSFLSDVEMAETADQSHTVKLACFLFKPSDQQHVSIVGL